MSCFVCNRFDTCSSYVHRKDQTTSIFKQGLRLRQRGTFLGCSASARPHLDAVICLSERKDVLHSSILFSLYNNLLKYFQHCLTLQWMTTTCKGSAFSQLSMALQMVQILSSGGACRSGQPVSSVCKHTPPPKHTRLDSMINSVICVTSFFLK